MIVRFRIVLASTIAASVMLTACLPSLEQVAPDDSTPWPGGNPAPTASVDPTSSAVYDQTVDWTPCSGLECATIEVPLDWTNPNGATITLALNRSEARNPEERIGSLLINPGGPGGSGLEITDYFTSIAGDDLLDHYDIIGFDPRGVGQSTPIDCGTGEELDAYFLVDDVIETEDQLEEARQRNADFAQRCRELTGPLIENVDTTSAARDMDVIRAVVGDEKLNYLGYSYGTQLGAVYAALYPENVGRVVLDGAVDFLLPPDELSLGQAGGFEQALDAYIADCLTSSDCPLPPDADLAKRTIGDMLIEARDHGIPTTGDDLNGTMLIYGIVVTLYDQESWWYLTESLTEVIERGTGRNFMDLANVYLERSADGEYQSNSNEAFTAISCLDTPEQSPMSISEFRDYQRSAEEASPTFGWWFGAGAGCEGWPFRAKELVQDLGSAADAAPMVIIGTTGDPATPIAWARSLAEQFPNATLIVYNGEGHTAYGRSNDCVIDAVDAYFVSDTIPESGLTC